MKHKLGVIILLALATGMRLGEILALKWQDIDFDDASLTVRHTLNRLKNYDNDTDAKTTIVIGEPKTANSKRVIPLNTSIMKRLKIHKGEQAEERLRLGSAYQISNFIFANSFGNSIEPRTCQDAFHRMIKLAKIDNANFHCLRHPYGKLTLKLSRVFNL